MTKVKKSKIKVGLKGLNIAMSSSMPRFWIGTGEKRKIECNSALDSRGDIYLSAVEDDRVIIKAGRKWTILQSIEADEVVTVIAKVMEPNPDVTDEQLTEIDDLRGAGTSKNYKAALKAGQVQMHLSSVVEEVEDDDED